ncbi:CapD: UDP-glucose 4-epimerase [Desulfosarcina variabilis str. Montpellier]|uniref:polysaccharide biosynthesis protein n=1 Tax=Desulfosarcina variabilis TaxID=2300 RepID=UPI003AFAA92E
MNSFFNDKRVLVTGACGTVGKELVRQLLEEKNVEELIALDNNESELFFLEQQFSYHTNCHYFLSDVRDRDKLTRKMKGIDIVFHTAAFKHVILCERSPFEAVQTNILGVNNIIYAAISNNVKRVIFTSSDKAVNPTNVMGTSKLMGERIMTAANSNQRQKGPIFASTRFGNVLGSRGSVVPVFREQIRNGGPITLTDPEMTRFIMSIKDAARLVIESSFFSCGGEVFVTKMPAIRIKDLAAVMIEQLAPRYGHPPEEIAIELIGAMPGEKMYEELMNQEETRRSWELECYFVVLPAFSGIYHKIDYSYADPVLKKVDAPYHSGNEKPLSKSELGAFLTKHNIIEF